MKSLILEAQAGNALAKEALVRFLTSRVESCSRYYGRRSGEDADDLKQEMWVGVFAALGRVDVSIGDPVQYLLVQGRFALLTSLRRRRPEAAPLECEEQLADGECLERLVVDGQLAQAFVSSLDAMASRIVGLLLEGHTRSDAARFLGCTPANVTYHLRRVESSLQEVRADTW